MHRTGNSLYSLTSCHYILGDNKGSPSDYIIHEGKLDELSNYVSKVNIQDTIHVLK